MKVVKSNCAKGACLSVVAAMKSSVGSVNPCLNARAIVMNAKTVKVVLLGKSATWSVAKSAKKLSALGVEPISSTKTVARHALAHPVLEFEKKSVRQDC